MATNEQKKKQFLSDPNHFITETIHSYVKTSPANRLVTFGNAPIFEEPLIGFADGDDPLFNEYRQVVSERHFMPREILTKHLADTGRAASSALPHIGIISFVLPVNPETTAGNAKEKEGPSLRWNHTRWQGQAFITELTNHLVSFLEEQGVWAVAPDLTSYFRIDRKTGTYASNWSHRHMAYAAGLGTFSLNNGFITSKGMAMRCGSVVAALKLAPSVRPYAHFRANCLHFATGKCGVCITRCPGGALSKNGLDKQKCFDVIFTEQKPWLDGAHGPGYIGQYAGCGLCQTGVPCEHRIPPAIAKKTPLKPNAPKYE